jgi:hypothetical protein
MKPQIKLTCNLKFPDTSDGFGRFNITQGFEEGKMKFTLSCGRYKWRSTQWAMHKFISGFEEWCWMFEVA